MPALIIIAAINWGLGALVAAGVISLFGATMLAISAGLSYYQQARAKRRAREAYNASLQDRLVMTATVDQTRGRVYGRVRGVDGVLFKATRGEYRKYYTLIVALAGHEIDGIEDIYFEDTRIELDSDGYVLTAPWSGYKVDITPSGERTLDANGSAVITGDIRNAVGGIVGAVKEADGTFTVIPATYVGVNTVRFDAGPAYAGKTLYSQSQTGGQKKVCRVRFYNGSDGQDLSNDLATDFPGMITPGAHRFAGIALLRVDMEYDDDAFASGVPNPITVAMRGAKVLDPRENQAPDPFLSGGSVSGGAFAYGWSLESAAGVVASVVGVGSEDGLNFVDVRVAGTASASGGWAGVGLNPANRPVTGVPQVWFGGIYCRKVAGNAPSLPRLQLMGVTSAGAATEAVTVPTTAEALARAGVKQCRIAGSVSLANTSATKIDMRCGFQLTAGETYDVTLRLALPTLSRSADAIRFTENPALHALDWSLYKWGGGRSMSDILLEDFIAAANACDVSHDFVSVNGDGATITSPRPLYQCGIVCETDQNPLETLSAICEAMAGEFAWPGGQLSVRAGVYTAPVGTITADWISDKDSILMVKDAPRSELVNVITPTIADRANQYVAAAMPRVVAQDYVDIDGEEYIQELTFEGVNDSDHAAHVASVALKDARAAKTYTLPCNLLALQVRVFDNWTVNIPEIGLSNEVMRCVGWKIDFETCTVMLTMKATSAAIFDPDATFKRSDALPNTTAPNIYDVAPVGALTITSGTNELLMSADGTITPRIKVTWPAITDQGVVSGGSVTVMFKNFIETAWRSVTVAGDQNVAWLDGVVEGQVYSIYAFARNRLVKGLPGDLYAHRCVGKTQPPATPTLTSVVQLTSGSVRLQRNPSTELDWSRGVYQYSTNGGSTWNLMSVAQDRNGAVWEPTVAGALQFRVADVDTSGNLGAYSNTLALMVAQSIDPSATLFIKVNTDAFTGTTNYNECYLHGASSGVAADVDGTILVAGSPVTVPKGALLSSQGPGTYFILWDRSGTFSTVSGARPYVLGQKVGSTWQYDNNSAWTTLTLPATVVVIGLVVAGNADTNTTPGITSAAIFPYAWSPDEIAQIGTAAAWDLVGGRTRTYRVGAVGQGAAIAGNLPLSPALYDADTGSLLVNQGSMYRVAKIHRKTKVVTDLGAFNQYSAGARASMAAALNSIDYNHICVVFTVDEPCYYRFGDGLEQAMYRNGASRAVFGSMNFRYRGAYILVGIGGCGEGNGSEGYAGAVDSDVNAWLDGSFQLTAKGALTGVNLTQGARTITDYGYVGTTDMATNAATDVYTVNGGGVTISGLSGVQETNLYYTDVVSLTFVASASGTATVTADGTGIITTPSSGAASAKYAVLNTRIKINDVTLNSKAAAVNEDIGYGVTTYTAFTRSLSFAVTQGASYTVLLQAQKLDPNVSTVIDSALLKVEVIKR